MKPPEHTNLLRWVIDSIPNHICTVPTVKHVTDMGEVDVPPIVLSTYMKAISECWSLARFYGFASIYYNMEECSLTIHPSEITNKTQVAISQINADRVIKKPIDDISYLPGVTMYGIKYLYHKGGQSVISCELENLICDYALVVKHAAKKIANSYGQMIELGGIDTDDVPLLREVQDKISRDWEENKTVQAPEGSNLKGLGISLADLERILRPFQEAISSESGVPIWLLFPTITTSQFELESRVIWSQSVFCRDIMPVLHSLLQFKGYKITQIIPPTYRDGKWQKQLEVLGADVEYKKSATDRNNREDTPNPPGKVM
jgi:hypothetical protein